MPARVKCDDCNIEFLSEPDGEGYYRCCNRCRLKKQLAFQTKQRQKLNKDIAHNKMLLG